MLVKNKMKFLIALVAIILVGTHLPSHCFGFTQWAAKGALPMGHEWLTRFSYYELVGNDPVYPGDPNDPRNRSPWNPKMKAKNLDLSSPGAQQEVTRTQQMTRDFEGKLLSKTKAHKLYGTDNLAVYSAVVGQRWVDLGGFNAMQKTKYSCWDAVNQETAEVQAAHFMRQWDDTAPDGGVLSGKRAQEEFKRFFVEAAMADNKKIVIYDGGAAGSTRTTVDQNYFLFGRAMHLFQDSFSPEHTIRIEEDGYQTVREVKSYLCAFGSEQHTHSQKKILNYTSGDVIWTPGTRKKKGWKNYLPSYMKTLPLVATEASKDLWAAFFRTMGTPRAQRQAVAEKEAQQLVNAWLSFDDEQVKAWYQNEENRGKTYVQLEGESGNGWKQPACLTAQGVKGTLEQEVKKLNTNQKICVYTINTDEGYEDLYDVHIHMPLVWNWKSIGGWKIPPPEWKVTDDHPKPVQMRRVRIKNAQNGKYVTFQGNKRNLICNAIDPEKGMVFNIVGSDSAMYLRPEEAPEYFFSYTGLTGAGFLFSGRVGNRAGKCSQYRLESISGKVDTYAIYSLATQQYFWKKRKDWAYLTRKGKKTNDNGQWVIEVLPDLP